MFVACIVFTIHIGNRTYQGLSMQSDLWIKTTSLQTL